MGMRRILIVNLDGALLDYQHVIPPSLKTVIRDIAPCCDVYLITAMPHRQAQPYYDDLALRTPIVCCHGSYLYDYHQQRVLQKCAISKLIALEFLEVVHQFDVRIIMHIDDAVISTTEEALRHKKPTHPHPRQNVPSKHVERCPINDFETLIYMANDIWKFELQGHPGVLALLANHPTLATKWSHYRLHLNRCTFTAKSNSNRLLNYLMAQGIQGAQVCAVGAGAFDEAMLQYAGYGIAMSDAPWQIKQLAQYECPRDAQQHSLATKLNALFFH